MREVRRQWREKKERRKRICDRAAGEDLGMEIVDAVGPGKGGGENALRGGRERHGIVGAVGDQNLNGNGILLTGFSYLSRPSLREAAAE